MDTPEKKVIVLIKHGLYSPFIELAQIAQGETFLKENHGDNIKVIHYYGIPVRPAIQKIDALHEKLRWLNRTTNIFLRGFDYVLLVPFMLYIPKVTPSKILNLPDEEFQCLVPDTLPTLRWKQLAIYRHILENYDFDFVFDTNVSSYIDFKNLQAMISNLSDDYLYAGNIPFGNFVSGANRIFNRKTLLLLVQKRIHWNPGYLEDLGIGKVMSRFGVAITVTDSHSIPHPENLEELSFKVLQKNYHFRVKCQADGRRLDAQTMKGLHERFKQFRAHQD